MALSCHLLGTHLSLSRLCVLGTNRATNCLYPHYVSCQSRLYQCRHYSSSRDSRYAASIVNKINSKCGGFFKRRFPRFYMLYQTSVQGFKLLFQHAWDVRRIKLKMYSDGLQFQDLPYRDMERLRQFRRDMIKAIPLLVMSVVPFANYLAFVLMYYFPRQILIPPFWTPTQRVEFWGLYHSLRAQHYLPVLKGFENVSHQVKEGHLKNRFRALCSQVQRGQNPKAPEILALRGLFSGPPLSMNKMSVDQMRLISPVLFLTPHLPGFLVGRRLNRYALELLQLDRALSWLGPQQLSDSELREACYLRGLDSYNLDINQCRDWLSQWLQVSSSLKASEVSLLLYSIVFLSANYPNGPRRQ